MSKNLTTATEEQSEYTRCACHAFEIQSWKGEVPEGADPGDYAVYEGTNCTQMTHRTFAPGHDAKLKSLLIKAGAAGLEIVRHEGGMNVYSSAEQVANHFGFGHQVLSGIQRAQAKAEARAEKKAAVDKARADLKNGKVTPEGNAALKADNRSKKAKAAARGKKAAGITQPVTIKVGRWTYEATIDPDTNAAQYTSANGEIKTAAEGKYKLVVAA